MIALLAVAILAPRHLTTAQIETLYLRETRAHYHTLANRHEARCFSRIIFRESRGDTHCRTGRYFGLGQLGPPVRRRYGGNTTNPREQIRAAIKYIRSRYHRPSRAWKHWQRHRSY